MQWKKRASAAAFVFLIFAGILHPALFARAAAGTVYSCTINRCYAHPVTGDIEDPGGESSYATGQGMAEGAVANTGIMEVTADGAYYLTFRVSLADYISSQSFFVQNVGDTGWSAVTPAVTANGSGSNGATADLRIQAPSENCIVKGSMYVTPMGRNVIFYFYPNNYTEGNATGMTAAMVTEAADSGTDAAQTETEYTAQMNEAAVTDASEETTQAPALEEPVLADSTEQAADAPANESASDAALSSAQGLSLSTAKEAAAEPEAAADDGGNRGVELVVAAAVSVTISGLILMTAAAGFVYYFRKNWRRWGGYDDEEYDDEEV